MSNAFNLFRLQQVDSQLDDARARLAEIEAILGDSEALQHAKAQLVESEDAHAEAERELRRAEDEVKAQQIKIEQNQSRMYGGSVTNPKELEDLQQEAEALKRHLTTLEDIQLEKMVASEGTQERVDTAKRALKQLRSELAEQHGELGEEQGKLLDEAEKLEAEREAAANGVDGDGMARYQKLRKSKGGIAVAKVSDKTCTACGTTLSATLAQAARSPNELSYCSTCKRILYAG